MSECLIDGCDRPVLARGLCKRHYSHFSAAGRLGEFPRRNNGRIMSGIQYVRVWAPGHPLAMRDNYVLEHRKVLYDAGIDVPPECHVHHRNGDKHDNRIENLEVVEESEHHRHHIAEAGEVVNQYGTFRVVTDPVERRARALEHWAQNRAKARLSGPPCPVCGEPCGRDNQTCSRKCGGILRSAKRALMRGATSE